MRKITFSGIIVILTGAFLVVFSIFLEGSFEIENPHPVT